MFHSRIWFVGWTIWGIPDFLKLYNWWTCLMVLQMGRLELQDFSVRVCSNGLELWDFEIHFVFVMLRFVRTGWNYLRLRISFGFWRVQVCSNGLELWNIEYHFWNIDSNLNKISNIFFNEGLDIFGIWARRFRDSKTCLPWFFRTHDSISGFDFWIVSFIWSMLWFIYLSHFIIIHIYT